MRPGTRRGSGIVVAAAVAAAWLTTSLAAAAAAPPVGPPGAGSLAVLAPVADVAVGAAPRGARQGRRPWLPVGAGSVAYLRFDLRSLASEPLGVRLELYARAGTAKRLVLRGADDAWEEGTLTAATRPATTTPADVLGPRPRAGRWLAADVGSLVDTDGFLSVAISLPSGRAELGSRESGETAPRLLVRLASPPAVAALPDATVATLGDTVYDRGTPAEFRACYAPSWGAFRSRTRPAPGNHDYGTPGAAGYFAYFGAAAGDPAEGWYSYHLGAWHVVALNSNCWAVGGCEPGSPQERWLRADLASNPSACTLAYWHHPLFNAGLHGPDRTVRPLVRALERAGAELVLAGHDHNYQRFAPQDADGNAAPRRGIRHFVVGTGGKSLYPVGTARHLEVADDQTPGVLVLTLRPGRYDWRFVPVAGSSFTDAGSAPCH